uniref:O-acyltransferase WSD1 C-terminal domain-containing protein n=1 Tax=Brassica oleracea TaxID=3712 RepID=A0A3P6APW0_BRAOL|nr:unnamed protein product [Brassica oleracea]
MAREKQAEITIMEPLSPVSRLFVSPGFYGAIVFTLGFKTRCNSSAIVEGIKNTWIKLPRFSSKVKVNDVLLGITQAGLSRYLRKKYGEDPVTEKKKSLEETRLRGTIAVNLRPETKIKAVEAITKRVFSHTTLTFSNVLGPNEDISFFEHPMCYVGASALIGPQALIIHYVSYADKIIINLAVDTTVIPDPHLLCDNLVESLEIIKLSLLEKGLHKMEV